jgi:hypothetical protein
MTDSVITANHRCHRTATVRQAAAARIATKIGEQLAHTIASADRIQRVSIGLPLSQSAWSTSNVAPSSAHPFASHRGRDFKQRERTIPMTTASAIIASIAMHRLSGGSGILIELARSI